MKKLAALTLLLSIGGCSSLPKSVTDITDLVMSETTIDASMLYLRGEFNWWDATQEYKLKPLGQGVYATKVDLIADGQPFKFKFADEHWTDGSNCGLEQPLELQLEVRYPLDCATQSSQSPFIFRPAQSGSFLFKFHQGSSPQVEIIQL